MDQLVEVIQSSNGYLETPVLLSLCQSFDNTVEIEKFNPKTMAYFTELLNDPETI